MKDPKTLIAQVISLPHRADRREQFARRMAGRSLIYTFVDGVVGTDPISACIQAHKACIARAQVNKAPMTLVMEDDAFFTSAGADRYYLEQMPEDFDLYLGGAYGHGVDHGAGVRWFSGTHCYVIHERFYQRFLELPEVEHIDRALSRLKAVFRVCQPYVCMQESGHSDGTGKFEAYGEWGKEKWYKG